MEMLFSFPPPPLHVQDPISIPFPEDSHYPCPQLNGPRPVEAVFDGLFDGAFLNWASSSPFFLQQDSPPPPESASIEPHALEAEREELIEIPLDWNWSGQAFGLEPNLAADLDPRPMDLLNLEGVSQSVVDWDQVNFAIDLLGIAPSPDSDGDAALVLRPCSRQRSRSLSQSLATSPPSRNTGETPSTPSEMETTLLSHTNCLRGSLPLPLPLRPNPLSKCLGCLKGFPSQNEMR